MRYLLTPDVAKRAIDMIWPSVSELIDDHTFKRSDLHIVIARRTGFAYDEEAFQADILHRYDIGDRDKWEAPFDEIAYRKCFQSWRSGLSTHEIQTQAPHLLEVGDTVYFGSVVSDGIVVACSGIQPYFDEMISSWVLAAIKALCKQGREELEKTHAQGFIR